MRFVDKLDGFFRRHPRLSIPLAVVYKYFDDQGPYLASILTYYAFIAIFPLMLLATSILGFVLEGKPEWQETILNTALAQFPIIGDQLGRPEGLQGSTGGVIVGAVAALYGILGVGQAGQNALYVGWSVPRNNRANPVMMRLRSLFLLLTAGLAVLAVSLVSTLLGNSGLLARWLGWDVGWLLPIGTVVVVTVMVTLLFKLARVGDHRWGSSLPGAFTLAVLWQLLQYGGAFYVEHVLQEASAMNQTFGLVLGLIGFLYIAAIMAVLSIEVNAVLGRRLYPRALLTPFTDAVHLTDADRRAYRSYAKMQRHKGFETVRVRFDEDDE